MLWHHSAGELPNKHHTALRDQGGRLRYEECLSRRGFDGAYSLLYHRERPHQARRVGFHRGFAQPETSDSPTLQRRHLRTARLTSSESTPLLARKTLFFNEDVAIASSLPNSSDDCYFANGDADELVFVHEGGGTLKSAFGDLKMQAGDYLVIPKGVIHRFLLGDTPQRWLRIESYSGLTLPQSFRNDTGQLRMDAPYCERDFRLPVFTGPVDEGLRKLVVKRQGRFSEFSYDESPLDVVGWDGAVYPFCLPILAFQARTGAVHLPPTVFATFELGGAVVCSFVPRPVDFHPQAIPCPYPHSSVDVDEVLYYVSGDFVSRKGIESGSLSYHPAGIPHGPHPGAYEASMGAERTNELAVMLDCYRSLALTTAALSVEDSEYHDSFVG